MTYTCNEQMVMMERNTNLNNPDEADYCVNTLAIFLHILFQYVTFITNFTING